ncbi:MAG: hypothetical protein K2J63_11550 [Muribaculaceae bacterium]|nr:hypothetical protein [Muribaculaceae bacterium]
MRKMVEIMLMTPLDDVLAKSDNPDEFVQPYTEYLRRRDIFFSQPNGFTLSDTVYHSPYRFIPNNKHVSKYYTTNGVSCCTPPYYSVEGDAILLFPINIGSISSDLLIEDKFMAVYDDCDINCTDKVLCIEDDKIRLICKIDRIYRYEYEFIPDNNPEYKHCIGIVMRKKDHASFPIKLLLTDEGLKNKDKYIKIALDCIKYGDAPDQFCEEEEISLKKLRKEGTFPLKRISNTGIIIERSSLPSNPLEFFNTRQH